MLCSGCRVIVKLVRRGKLKHPKCDWKPAMSKQPVILMFILHTKVARSTWNDEITAYFILNYYQSHWLERRREQTHSLSQELLAQETCSKLSTKRQHGQTFLFFMVDLILTMTSPWKCPCTIIKGTHFCQNKQTNKLHRCCVVLKEENTHFK